MFQRRSKLGLPYAYLSTCLSNFMQTLQGGTFVNYSKV